MKRILIALCALTVAVTVSAQTVKVDPKLKSYKTVGGVAGSLNSVGSDTLNNLMTLWAEGFQKRYPNVKIQIEGKGSSTAPPALIEGTAQLGPMSREMKSTEVDAFQEKYGYKPARIKVSIDALAVFVHKDNPVKGLNLEQIDAIFSKTYKRGGQPIATWRDLGLKGQWGDTPISLFGRNTASGTYSYFKKVALDSGDYKDTVKAQPGSSAVVQGVATTLGGIGYSGIGYKTSSVRALPLAVKGNRFNDPSLANCMSGDYPLARFLNVYVNKKPNEKMDKLTLEFVKFVLSKEGQEIVVKDGYYPLPASVAEQTLKELTD